MKLGRARGKPIGKRGGKDIARRKMGLNVHLVLGAAASNRAQVWQIKHEKLNVVASALLSIEGWEPPPPVFEPLIGVLTSKPGGGARCISCGVARLGLED